jgi:hypothetical protein
VRRRAASLTFAALVLCALGITLIVWRATEEKERAPVRETAVRSPAPEEQAPRQSDLEALPPEPAEAAPVPAEPAAERSPRTAPGLVIGTVRLEDGALPLGVEVALRGLRGEPRTLETVADGAFRFDDVTPGRIPTSSPPGALASPRARAPTRTGGSCSNTSRPGRT